MRNFPVIFSFLVSILGTLNRIEEYPGHLSTPQYRKTILNEEIQHHIVTCTASSLTSPFSPISVSF
jgi:hypothetical protein